MSCCSQSQAMPVAQNDVADILNRLAAFLAMLAGLFTKKTTTQALSVCEQTLVDEIKAEVLALLSRLPPMVQRYINCKLGLTPAPAPLEPQGFGLGSVGALAGLGDLAKYLKYLPQILEVLKSIGPILDQLLPLLKGLAPAGPASPADPAAPLQPSGYAPRGVQRCA